MKGRKSRDAENGESSELGEVLSFMRLLWAVTHGLNSVSKRMHSQLGVTGPQRLVLRMLGRYNQMSAGELARVLHVHPSSLTGVLRRLEHAGLLRRTVDPEDARRAVLTLTRKGQLLNSRRVGTVEWVVRRALASVSDSNKQGAEAVLKALASELEADRSE